MLINNIFCSRPEHGKINFGKINFTDVTENCFLVVCGSSRTPLYQPPKLKSVSFNSCPNSSSWLCVVAVSYKGPKKRKRNKPVNYRTTEQVAPQYLHLKLQLIGQLNLRSSVPQVLRAHQITGRALATFKAS